MNHQDGQQRVALIITGAVQGVGFRPYVYRLAKALSLTGFVCNNSSGVIVEAEGAAANLEALLVRLPVENPPPSFIQNIHATYLDPCGYDEFTIEESGGLSSKTAVVLPDLATCPQCLEEIFDPGNRRYLYPFTNCTHCGPRYSIIEAIPYDRTNTSMKGFMMCDACRREYESPENRRFHAQPNACPECGPHVELWGTDGNILIARQEAIDGAVGAIKAGKIIAVKGIGGFHLLVDAHDDESVRRLRERKRREEKPFALLFPSIEAVEKQCEVSLREKALLQSNESPIVLLRKLQDATVAGSVAPGNPYLGAMLPYSPLHHILMRQLGRAVVATSANLSEEPICIDEHEALERLAGIADLFLVHDRPILRSIDDSVVRVMMGRPLVVRRARGYAPLPVSLQGEVPTVLAAGGHLKNTIALTIGNGAFLSQHIGDLQTEQSLSAFRKGLDSLQGIYGATPISVACDMHPDYLSTKFAHESTLPVVKVQHHHAHVAACMAENHLDGTVLGIVWDGAGYGPDGTVWGGEFLKADLDGYTRVAHMRTFLMPGGDKAAVEPRRAAAAVLYDISGGVLDRYMDLPPMKAFTKEELNVLKGMMDKKLNAPATSSVGRLFDAAASLLGIRQTIRFEGQAAMELEHVLEGVNVDEDYEFDIGRSAEEGYVLDWAPVFRALINDLRDGAGKAVLSARFHNTLVEMAVDIAREIGEPRIVLSGGCFQNRYLTERMVLRLREEGFKVYWHQLVPPNDGGIALGQAVVAAHRAVSKVAGQ